jgi:hypothetical protein
MTAAMLADLLHARPSGRSRWQARCPAHDDSSPSLSICEGRDGRTLVRCWAGCALASILEAAGLKMADLFDGPPPSAQQVREAALERERCEQEQQAAHHAAVERNRELLKLESLKDALGGLLARHSGEDEVLHPFTGVIEKLRSLEVAERQHEDGPHRQGPSPEMPVEIAEALREVFAPEPSRQRDPSALTFAEVSELIEIQDQKTEAASKAA